MYTWAFLWVPPVVGGVLFYPAIGQYNMFSVIKPITFR
jgi:hypothetical protein